MCHETTGQVLAYFRISLILIVIICLYIVHTCITALYYRAVCMYDAVRGMPYKV